MTLAQLLGLDHWKTTLAGVLLAGAHVTVNGVTPKQMAVAFLFAALGYLASDKPKPQA